MNMKKIPWLLMLLFLIPAMINAETISTVYVDGKAPIIIDGDLSDWNSLDIKPIKLTQFNQKYSKPEKWDGESDLSASFVCCADDEYVYVGVIVTDDQLIFGEAPIDRPYWDDCVELFLYGNNPDAPIHIWVTASKDGRTKLEGQELGSKRFIPYYWEKQGVKAKLKRIGIGYVVEIAVPLESVSRTEWVKGKSLGMNVGVYDDDDGELYDNILEWTIIWGEIINTVAFDSIITSSESVTEQNENEKELEIVVSVPGTIKYSDDPEILYGIAKAYEKAGLFLEAIEELNKIIVSEVNSFTMDQAKLALALNYFYINDFKNSKRFCEDLTLAYDPKIRLNARLIEISLKRKELIMQ